MKSIALLLAICAMALFSGTDAEAKRYKAGWHGNSSHVQHSGARRSRAYKSSRRAHRGSYSRRSTRGRGRAQYARTQSARAQSGWHYAGESRPRRSRRSRAVRSASYASGETSDRGYASRSASYGGGHSAGPRPSQWCGWWMRTQLGGGAHYNLARSWRSYGSPTAPQVGAVVVVGNHVGIITGRSAGGWVVKAGNDGGRVRERVWSLAGASIRI